MRMLHGERKEGGRKERRGRREEGRRREGGKERRRKGGREKTVTIGVISYNTDPEPSHLPHTVHP